MFASSAIAIVRGTRRDDTLLGKPRAEEFFGLDGNDTIDADGGDDIVRGGAGNDILNGMDGRDLLYGNDGNDVLFGGASSDTFYGGAGDDYLSGGGGDWLYGEDGDDVFSLSTRDRAFGGSGGDTFAINDKSAEIHAGAGIDTIKFNKQIRQFAFIYGDDGLLVRYTAAATHAPKPMALADEEIEKIAFGRGVVIDRRDVSTPEILEVYNGRTWVTLDSAITTEILGLRGQADPGARVTIKDGDVVFGVCVADENGQWTFVDIDPDKLAATMHLMVVADYGLADHVGTSSIVEIHTPFALGDLTRGDGLMFEGAHHRYAADLQISLGDVNGDGMSDLAVVSAPSRIAVIYGNGGWENGLPDIETLDPSKGYIVDIEANVVRPLGDINGDGEGDFAIVGSALPAEVAIIFGTSGSPNGRDGAGRAVFLPEDLDGTGGFVLRADGYYNLSQVSMTSAGDINGDGIGDILIGARNYSDAVSNSGKAYVLFGGTQLHQGIQDGIAFTDLDNLDPARGFAITTSIERNFMGREVSWLGDINGDSIDDIMVSGTTEGGMTSKTRDYVIFGSTDGFGELVDGRSTIDLTTLGPEDGLVLKGNTTGNSQFTNIGDFNGDGINDLFVSTAVGTSDVGGTGAGYLVFGTSGSFGTISNGQAVIDLANLPAAKGVVFTGQAGGEVGSIGDFNGDGYDDFIMHERAPSQQRYVRVIFGTSDPLGELGDGQRVLDTDYIVDNFVVDVTTVASSLNATNVSAGAAGDINKDGYDDLLITLEPDWWAGGLARSYIFYGHEM